MGMKIPPNLEKYMAEENAQKVSIQYMIEQLGCQLHDHILFKETYSLKNRRKQNNINSRSENAFGRCYLGVCEGRVSQTIKSMKASGE